MNYSNLIVFQASDKDNLGPLHFKVTEKNPSGGSSAFSMSKIDDYSASLEIVRGLDYESQRSHELTIVVEVRNYVVFFMKMHNLI